MQYFCSQLETLNHKVICIPISQQGTDGDLQKANLQVSTFRRWQQLQEALRHRNTSLWTLFLSFFFLTLSCYNYRWQRYQQRYSMTLLFHRHARENPIFITAAINARQPSKRAALLSLQFTSQGARVTLGQPPAGSSCCSPAALQPPARPRHRPGSAPTHPLALLRGWGRRKRFAFKCKAPTKHCLTHRSH